MNNPLLDQSASSPLINDPLSQDISGKVVLVTGGTSGIGFFTARELARLGAHVVILCRDPVKGKIALEEIHQVVKKMSVEVLITNLASQSSIRTAVGEFLKTHSRLDVLINNAGIIPTKRIMSTDGFEETFAVNHLGPFLLTKLLLPLLKASAPARIINVSSQAHRMGYMKWEDLSHEKNFKPFQVYAQSKLANILFTRELAKQLHPDEITVNCVHPGIVSTQLVRKHSFLVKGFFKVFGVSSEKGARRSVYLATSQEVANITGGYFVRNKLHKPSRNALNDTDAARLWEISEQWTALSSKANDLDPQ